MVDQRESRIHQPVPFCFTCGILVPWCPAAELQTERNRSSATSETDRGRVHPQAQRGRDGELIWADPRSDHVRRIHRTPSSRAKSGVVAPCQRSAPVLLCPGAHTGPARSLPLLLFTRPWAVLLVFRRVEPWPVFRLLGCAEADFCGSGDTDIEDWSIS
jgi:hypothetical protein